MQDDLKESGRFASGRSIRFFEK